MRTLTPGEKFLWQRRIPLPGKLRLVIDSDAKNEVDDQFAISWAIRSPERFRVEAVYAVPFSHTTYRHNLGQKDYLDGEIPGEGMEKSYQEIRKLFSLLGQDPEGRVFRGADRFLEASDKPVDSEAARDLIRRAMASEEPLYVAAIGAATNIASALLLEPALAERITVVWLGGQPVSFSHGQEFNLTQDIFAAQVLFRSGVPLIWIPCMTVASQLSLSDADVREKLLGKSDIGTYLAQIVLEQFPNLQKAVTRAETQYGINLAGQDDLPKAYRDLFSSKAVAWSRTIWDISTIGFLKNPNWVLTRLEPTPVLLPDCRWQMPNGQSGSIRVAHYCQRDLLLGDLLECLQ